MKLPDILCVRPLEFGQKDKQERYVYIKIKDDGIGIAPRQQYLVFKKFYRIPTGNIHNVKGLGLGLYLSKQVIEAHHGIIELQKTANGACFLIRLKLTPSSTT